MPPVWEGRVNFATRDPQRVCEACAAAVQPFQVQWASENANANRTNHISLEDYSTRYMNSPLRFTLGGEVRKAAYSLRNMSDGINFWDRDSEYFDQQLVGAKGLLFMTVGKIAFIGGVRVGTGLVVARLSDSSWSAPCAVGSFGLTFGAVVGAEVTDFVTPLDSDAIAEFCNTSTSKLSMGGEVGFAFGPLGRTAAGDGIVASDGSTTSATSYAQSRGFYGGVTIDGAYLKVRDDVNLKFYGRPVTAAHILRGTETQPTAASPLYDQLNQFYGEMEQRAQQRRQFDDHSGSYDAGGARPSPPSATSQSYAANAPPPSQSYNSNAHSYSNFGNNDTAHRYQPSSNSAYESFPYDKKTQHSQQQPQQHTGAVGDSLWGSRPPPQNPFDAAAASGGSAVNRDVVEV